MSPELSSGSIIMTSNPAGTHLNTSESKQDRLDPDEHRWQELYNEPLSLKALAVYATLWS